MDSGNILLSLTEDHLKEMGISKVGHRVKIVSLIDGLRRGAALISREKYSDISALLAQ